MPEQFLSSQHSVDAIFPLFHYYFEFVPLLMDNFPLLEPIEGVDLLRIHYSPIIPCKFQFHPKLSHKVVCNGPSSPFPSFLHSNLPLFDVILGMRNSEDENAKGKGCMAPDAKLANESAKMNGNIIFNGNCPTKVLRICSNFCFSISLLDS